MSDTPLNFVEWCVTDDVRVAYELHGACEYNANGITKTYNVGCSGFADYLSIYNITNREQYGQRTELLSDDDVPNDGSTMVADIHSKPLYKALRGQMGARRRAKAATSSQ